MVELTSNEKRKRCQQLPVLDYNTPIIKKHSDVEPNCFGFSPDYSDEIRAWMDAMYALELVDVNYNKNIEGIREKKASEMSMNEILTMMTYYLRGERFCDGLISSAMREGQLPELSLRLQEITTCNE